MTMHIHISNTDLFPQTAFASGLPVLCKTSKCLKIDVQIQVLQTSVEKKLETIQEITSLLRKLPWLFETVETISLRESE